jgi:hypothetical protein
MRTDALHAPGGRETGDRQLLWIAASSFYMPEAPPGWRLVDLAGNSEINSRGVASASRYSVVFEATFNSRLDYDPVLQTRAVRQFFTRAPDTLVAVVAPSLEVPVDTQHAIACEAGLVLGSPRVDIVTITEQWSQESVGKMRKTRRVDGP